MTNSYESYVLDLYKAIFTDIQVQYPHLQKDLGRDYSRLLSCIETRGLSFFTIDLVDFGKHFDLCLSNQRLILSSLPYQRGYKSGTPIPRLFKGLMLRVFDISGMLRSDCDVRSIHFLRQLYYTAKKLRIESADVRKRKVIEQFYAVESGIRGGSEEWFASDPRWDSNRSSSLETAVGPDSDTLPLPFKEEVELIPPPCSRDLLRTIQSVADIISTTLGVFKPLEWRTQHGPGAVSDANAGVSKYSFPYWPQKLENVFPYADFAFANYGLWVEHSPIDTVSSHEPPSKLILVPKTLKAPRLIASEPISHQWCQQAVKDFIDRRTSSSWLSRFITFRDQTGNQRMAARGSLDGSLSTIDLSEASDRLSLWLVERCFRRSETLLSALHATRTRTVLNRTGYGVPGVSKLRKFACMGSACTFPIQTIVFLMIALGSVLDARGLKPTIKNLKSLKGQVRVFGDDIIVPTDAAVRTMEALALLGLVVNRNKTFWNGSFRESCGLDVFKGINVTPTYIMTLPSRSKPGSIVSVVESHNNFLSRGWLHAADYLAKTVRSCSKTIMNVAMDSGSFGLKTYDLPDNTHLRARFNKDLHRYEYFASLVSTKVLKTRDRGDSMLLQYFIEAPSQLDNWQGGYTSRPLSSLRHRWVDSH